ncbi:hypothetical protein X743_32585 [Mesorhizobium sp. LNHC252B00]|nr:hypothetical protein X743_32585 [Mesorhizobium sp. LNHC252B00]
MPAEHAEAEARFGRPLLSGHYFERILGCNSAVAVQNDPLLMDISLSSLRGPRGSPRTVVVSRGAGVS